MAEPDYYGLIGVEKNATLQEIRTKFRQKVLAEHPDKGGDPKKFQLLNKAYNVLADQEKRRRYDATGRAEKTAEEEFVEGFGGGRMSREQRSKDADSQAVVNLQDRIASGPTNHEDGFAQWLRQRDQSEMVLTDKDFMRTALFNAAELATDVKHTGPVQHVLGSPKTDSTGQPVPGPVQTQVKRNTVKKTIDHDELVLKMISVPVEHSMVYPELNKSRVCLGMTGIGRVEQAGQRIEELKPDDTVLVLPKPTKFPPQRPIGTARTLLICSEEDVIKIPAQILEELTPEQLCLTPTIVCAYMLLETYSAKLKPGDSVLLNAAHLSASGSALLQLCKLLKLKPLCLLELPGAPRNLVQGEYGDRSAWKDAESRSVAPPTVQAKYERISEWLVSMGAEEVFPDAPALLKWRDRNQRMLPKVALDGIAAKDSAEQLIHCLQPGDKDGTLVVYGHGSSQPMSVSPPLLAAWGGSLTGFNIARWVHGLSANSKKMMSIMENVTKLVRANKFVLDTQVFMVGEDSIADAFAKAADATDREQVVLTFPTLQEELKAWKDEQGAEQRRIEAERQEEKKKKAEEDERAKLKQEWLDLLFTEQSVAAMSVDSEGPLPTTLEISSKRATSSLIVWVGDQAHSENTVLKDLPQSFASSQFISLSWAQHQAAEGLAEVSLTTPEVLDGSWYKRDRADFKNEDLDLLHDVELLGRAMVEAIKPVLSATGLSWRNVVIAGFGKGAGIALYASLLRMIPAQVSALVLFGPIAPFPNFMSAKLSALPRRPAGQQCKIFTIWGSHDKSTPSGYRQLLQQVLRKVPDAHSTPDSLPEVDHVFDSKGYGVLESLLPLCLPR